jgi:hypothetical protein
VNSRTRSGRGPATHPRGESIGEFPPARLRGNFAGWSVVHARRDGRGRRDRSRRDYAAQPGSAVHAGQFGEAAVAAEELIPAGPSEGHLGAGLPDDAADEVGVDPVEGGLVKAVHSIVEVAPENLLREAKLVVFCAELLGDAPGAREETPSGTSLIRC